MATDPNRIDYVQPEDNVSANNMMVRGSLLGDGVAMVFVDGNPNGVITGVVGQLAVDQSTSTVYQNTDDEKSWEPFGGGAGVGFISRVTYSGSGDHTFPAGTRFVRVSCIGGGGGGGGAQATDGGTCSGAGGGGSGEYVLGRWLPVAEGTEEFVVVVGDGGLGGVGPLPGNPGGASEYGHGPYSVECAGGGGGGWGPGQLSFLCAAGGTVDVPMDEESSWGNGSLGIGWGTGTAVGGAGGASPLGAGGNPPAINTSGDGGWAENGYGGGGAGAANRTSQPNRTGGNGRKGVVIVEFWG